MTFCNEPVIVPFSAEGLIEKAFKTAEKQALAGIIGRPSGQWRKLIVKTICIMKLTTFILLLATFQASAIGGHAQKITLSVKDASLEEVFTAIRKQSGYHFFYNTEQVRKAEPITVSIRNAGIEEALTICLKDQPFTYTILGNVITLKKRPEVINPRKDITTVIDIHGKVMNEKNEGLGGATVAVKKTTLSTVTASNGEFSLTGISEDAVLVISYVGYTTQEIKLNGRTDISIQLKLEIGELGIVTVETGFQEIPKERATGSFTKINNETLSLQVGTNILSRLDGVASSVTFPKGKRDAPTLMVRGLSTILGPKEPLIVVDNFPYEGDINNINPNDVESITILKDAAAASIWGTRAGNGVIVITTKKGKLNQPLRIEFNSNVTVTGKPDLFYVPQMSSGDYIDVEQLLFNKGYFNSQINSSLKPGLSPAVEVFIKRKNGQISAADSAAQINSLKVVDIRNQYNNYFYQNAVKQQYALNLRGGKENIAYLISVGYDENIDNLSATYRRLNLRVDNLYRPVKDLDISLGLFYTDSRTETGKPAYNSILVNSRQVPYLSFSDANGMPLSIDKDLRKIYTDTAGASNLLDWKYYPLTEWQLNKTTGTIKDFLANLGVTYRVFKGLSVDVKYQYERQYNDTRNLQDVNSYAARNMINRFSQLDRTTNTVNYFVPKGAILNISETNLETQRVRGQLNYIGEFGERFQHRISVIAGGEIQDIKTTGNANTIYGYNDNNLIISNVDFLNPYPSFINGSNSAIPNGLSLTNRLNRFVSVYSNFAYTYLGKYTFSASGRRDASNLFGLNTNDKWNPFWSAGLGWELSKEGWLSPTSIFSYLKLRVTYGFSGNVDQSRTAVATLTTTGVDPYTNLPSNRVNQFTNPDLRWERIQTTNVGIDYSIFKNIISGSIEYYTKKSTDLYGPTLVDFTAGLGTNLVVKNFADLKTSGLDVVINTKNINRTIKWNSSILFNYNKNKVTKYYSTATTANSFVKDGGAVSAIVGKPLYSIISYRWGGLDGNGNPLGYLADTLSKNYTAIANSKEGLDGLVYNGSALPVFFGALGNTFSWKGFLLTVNISFKMGYYFLKPSISYSNLISAGVGHSDYANRWQKLGDEALTNVPSFVYPVPANRDGFYRNSEVLVCKGDHIRLQFVNFSYDFSELRFRKMPFHNIQLYINANDLGILWRANKQGIDPDYISSFYPSKSFSIGLKAGL